MPEKIWVEIPVFIHGITPENEPNVQGIHENYAVLWNGIQAGFQKRNAQEFTGFTSLPIEIMWGFETGQADESDSLLAKAQSTISKQVIELESKINDSILLPRARSLYRQSRQWFTIGMADLFYYISVDGEKAVRKHVFSYISKKIIEAAHESNNISLTFIAHSAGSVIVHDLLYHLFRSTRAKTAIKGITDLRDLVRDDRLRVRRFYSMGSPITPTVFRSDSLLKKITKGELLDPEEKGLRESDNLSNPRWVNFWDIDDLAAFPVEFLYKNIANPNKNNKKVIEDKYIDVGDFLPQKVHGQYWANEKLADYIAETW